ANAFHSQIGTPAAKVVDPAIKQGADTQNLLTLGGLGVLDGGWTSSITKLVTAAQVEKAKEVVKATEAVAAKVEAEKAQLQAVETQLRSKVAGLGLGDKVEFTTTDRGLQMVLPIDAVLFESGSADLRPDGANLLATFAPTLRSLGKTIEVEGHTDSEPVGPGGRYKSNRGLSADRAATVADYLVLDQGFPSDLVRAAGLGDSHPIADNSTPAGRAKNRRVVITVLFAPEPLPGPAAAALLDGTAPPAAPPTAPSPASSSPGATAPTTEGTKPNG
ncbi:MAG: OmpA/MotB domain protein, partial [Acidimicrobiia bacterium]|nr:OmpA/MotB domain protein [Acidimicrobiia bacterium]